MARSGATAVRRWAAGDQSSYPVPVAERRPEEVEARVDERPDLLRRLDEGDTGSALGELIEHATGAEVASVKVTRPARDATVG